MNRLLWACWSVALLSAAITINASGDNFWTGLLAGLMGAGGGWVLAAKVLP